MDNKTDVEDLLTILSKLTSDEADNDVVTFKDKYKIILLRGWKPLPNLPDNFSQKCFIVFIADQSSVIPFLSSKSTDAWEISTICNSVGSLLECKFNLTQLENCSSISFIKSNLRFCYPMPISEARYFCDLYCKCFLQSEIPIFVLCDGQDRKHTILLGMSKGKRVVAFDEGIVMKKDQYPKLRYIKKKHLFGFSKTFSKIETSVYTYFDVLEFCRETQANSVIKPTANGVLALECSGVSLTSILQKTPADASCILYVQAVLGDEKTGAFVKYKELKILQALFNSLTTGKMVWYTEEKEKCKALDRLIFFMNEFRHRRTLEGILESPVVPDTSDFDSSFSSYTTGSRRDMDFTDYLWIILSDCSSYAELVDAFHYLFKELKKISFIPYVHSKNPTTVAKMIQSMDEKQPIVCPPLDSNKPVKLLLELGIVKLQKDYTALFVGLDMMPHHALLPFLEKFQNSEKAVKGLQKLHTIVELLIICWSFLRLPKLELRAFVKLAFEHYSSVSAVDPTYIFQFPLSLCSIIDFLNKAKPVVWQASLKSTCNGYEKQTVIHFTKKPEEHLKKVVFRPGMPFRPSNPSYFAMSAVLIDENVHNVKGEDG